MQVPRLDKVVLNMGVGEGVDDSKKVTAAAADLGLIAGQKPVITQGAEVDRHLQAARGHADRRQGDAAAEPHVRVRRPAGEHRAAARARLPRAQSRRASTGAATYAIGLKEHIIFPEIDYDKVEDVLGMDIIVCTTAHTDDEARALLQGLNFPFRS